MAEANRCEPPEAGSIALSLAWSLMSRHHLAKVSMRLVKHRFYVIDLQGHKTSAPMEHQPPVREEIQSKDYLLPSRLLPRSRTRRRGPSMDAT